MKNISEQCWTSTWPTHMWREGKRHPARPPTALSEGHFFNTSRSFDPVKLGNKGVDGGLHYTGNASEVQPERFNLILFSYQWKNITSYKRLILFILFLKAWWMTPIKCRKKKKKKNTTKAHQCKSDCDIVDMFISRLHTHYAQVHWYPHGFGTHFPAKQMKQNKGGSGSV